MCILRSSKFSERDSTIREKERERKHEHTESHSELIKQNRTENIMFHKDIHLNDLQIIWKNSREV